MLIGMNDGFENIVDARVLEQIGIDEMVPVDGAALEIGLVGEGVDDRVGDRLRPGVEGKQIAGLAVAPGGLDQRGDLQRMVLEQRAHIGRRVGRIVDVSHELQEHGVLQDAAGCRSMMDARR